MLMSSPVPTVTLVWDVDDVLNNLMAQWFARVWLPTHPNCRVEYAELCDNPPHQVLGVALATYLESLDTYRLSPAIRDLRPSPEILAWLAAYGAEYAHLALTARPLATMPLLAEWLYRHFGGYVRTISVVPSRCPPSLPAYQTDKAAFLRWFGRGDIVIDDNATNIAAARTAGLRGILFPQPWNAQTATVAETLAQLREEAEGLRLAREQRTERC
jgi:hypothetical protein